MRNPSRLNSRLAKFLRQLIAHQVHKIGSLACVHAAWNQVQRLVLGALSFLLGDRTRLHHRIQHQIPPFDRSIRDAGTD